jgi:hypothetical protein
VKWGFCCLFCLLYAHCLTSELLHCSVHGDGSEFTCELTGAHPFDEVIISWNATRPLAGSYTIQVSLFAQEWSDWLDYAWWGAKEQHTFSSTTARPSCRTHQDIVTLPSGQTATALRIRVTAEAGAALRHFRTLHACVSHSHVEDEDDIVTADHSVALPVFPLSQMGSYPGREHRLCSPASTVAVINYLMPSSAASVAEFSDAVWDSAFDLYGNWILNVAEASSRLGTQWQCAVTRLSGFEDILCRLDQGWPVVVSVRGPLPGSALPYAQGHLMVVRGYDAIANRVLCMDPAFAEPGLTYASYQLKDFLIAWRRRGNLAYIFELCK